MRFKRLILIVISLPFLSGCLVDSSHSSGNTVNGLLADSLRQDSLRKQAAAEASAQRKNEEVSDGPIRALIQKRLAQRDTALIAPEQLKPFALLEFEGFSAGEIEAQRVHLPSENVRISYISYELRHGGKSMVVRIQDLNGWHEGLVVAWENKHASIDFDARNEKSRALKLSDNITGFYTINEGKQTAGLGLLIGQRFDLEIKGTGFSSPDLLVKYAKAMKLKELARLSTIQ